MSWAAAPVRVGALLFAALGAGVAASCSSPPGPAANEPETRAETHSALTAGSAQLGAATTASAQATPTATPSAASSAALVPNRPDKTSFECGDKRCVAGKQTCCMHPAPYTTPRPAHPYESTCVEAPAAAPHIRDLNEVYAVECKTGPGLGKLTVFGRCDESQDCGPSQMCCHRYTFAKEASAQRCLPFVGVGAGPCPGDELCVLGGEPCRTPGAECIADLDRGGARCIKRPKSPDRVCETAADCLNGQRCLHDPNRPAACVDRAEALDPVPCTTHAECQAFCTDKRGICAGLGGGGKDAYPLCKCP
ncbi:MAG: hypothetical protein IPM79_32920 [Polyangiaceae bacterium]|nr:hypothetical protein [Polyangiaceae bacterium]